MNSGILSEDVISLRAAADDPLLRRDTDRPANFSTIWRYALRGCRSVSGKRICLEVMKTPSGMKTSRQAIKRFIAAINDAHTIEPSEADVADAHNRAEAALGAAGI